MDDAVTELQRDWEVIRYQTPAAEREKRFEALVAKAHKVSEQLRRPHRAAGVGRHHRQLAGPARRAAWARSAWPSRPRRCTSRPCRSTPRALDGSAYNSLGVLYYKVPGWPLGFGDKAKAASCCRRRWRSTRRASTPTSSTPSTWSRPTTQTEAVTYLERALQAPPRPGRQIADTGRREEVRALLAKVKAALSCLRRDRAGAASAATTPLPSLPLR